MSTLTTFADLGLPAHALNTLTALGYETPSPIQAASIPALLAGSDVLGQAQTGTGKTAAFALPLLSRIDTDKRHTQALVLTPTRELALQVAAAFSRYAQGMRNLEVLSIYGGQAYGGQLKSLRKGPQIVVGTPGRVMDHLRKGTLMLDKLQTLVLDEADEMLRMGFIEDVEWILAQTPPERQTALFSATLPKAIQSIAHRHLTAPEEVRIAATRNEAESITQHYCMVHQREKNEALTRILDVAGFDAAIVFVRTRSATLEVAERLNAHGFASTALNGDIPQAQREMAVNNLKRGKLDILVATDVAARGLDVERISHVINYDLPFDAESYVHRIGRTGRAGRTGDAISLVTSREKRWLRTFENATKRKVTAMKIPSNAQINAQRIARFKEKIAAKLDSKELETYTKLISEFQDESQVDLLTIAAATALMAQGETPLLAKQEPRSSFSPREKREPREKSAPRHARTRTPNANEAVQPLADFPDIPMQRYRVGVGHDNKVKPGAIVGAIANEAQIDSCYIGRIAIYDDHSTVDLPADMPRALLKTLKNAWVCGKKLGIAPLKDAKPPKPAANAHDAQPRKKIKNASPTKKNKTKKKNTKTAHRSKREKRAPQAA